MTEIENEKFDLIINVIDTGIGISENNINSLFKIFSKLKNASHINLEGVGLGLTICKSITESLDGWIEVRSKEKIGSNFTFCVKLDKIRPLFLDFDYKNI